MTTFAESQQQQLLENIEQLVELGAFLLFGWYEIGKIKAFHKNAGYTGYGPYGDRTAGFRDLFGWTKDVTDQVVQPVRAGYFRPLG